MFFLLKFIVFMFFNTASAMWSPGDNESYDLDFGFDNLPTSPNPSYQNSLPLLVEDTAPSNSETAVSNPTPTIPGERAHNSGRIGNLPGTAKKPNRLKFHTMSTEQAKNIGKPIKFHIVSAEEASGIKAATKVHTSSQEQASGKSGIAPRSSPKIFFHAPKRPSNQTIQSPPKRRRTTSDTSAPIHNDVDDEYYWFCPYCGVGLQRNSALHTNHQNICSFKSLKPPAALPSHNSAQAFSAGFNVPYPQVSSTAGQYVSSFSYETSVANENFLAQDRYFAGGLSSQAYFGTAQEFPLSTIPTIEQPWENASCLEEEYAQPSSSRSQTTPTSFFSPVVSPIISPEAPGQGVMNFPQEIQQDNVPEIDADLLSDQRADNQPVVELSTSEPSNGAEDLGGGLFAPEIPQVEEQPEAAQSILSASLICGYLTKESFDGISASCSQSFVSQDERTRHIGEFHIRTCHWFICPHGRWEKCLEGPFANVDALKKHVLNKHIQCSSKNIHH